MKNKKNKMMRVASTLFALSIVTTSMVSGTFAKYVVGAETNETARVAKFGVNVTASGSLFGVNYLAASYNTPTSDETGITVKSSEEEQNVVAPGTKSTENGMSFAVTGTPEVDVKISLFNYNKDEISDICLKAGTYPDLTKGMDEDGQYTNFEIKEDNDYYPIKYTLSKSGEDGLDEIVSAQGFEAFVEAVDNKNIVVKAGKNLAEEIGTYYITWEWPYEQYTTTDDGNVVNEDIDKADTLLGDLQAGTINTVDSKNYNLDVNLNFAFTVTQID